MQDPRIAAPRPGASAPTLQVLHIIPTLGIGGTERQLVRLLPRMDRRRFRQSVCFYTRTESLERSLHDAGIPTIFFDKFSMPPWTFFRRLRTVIRDTRPDIVHTWLYSANVWGRMAAVSCGVGTIVSSDRGIAEPAPAYLVAFERLLAGRTVRTANSRAAAASLEERYGLKRDRVRVILNAVDEVPASAPESRRDLRRSLGLPEEGRIVLMVARQSVEKNHAMYFRVAARVGARRPDVTFVSLGHLIDPAAMRDVLARSGAEPFVRLVEQREEVTRWLQAADLFCFTSDLEGLPNAVLEAMACGVPVVCTDFASAREVVPHEGVGVIVRRGDDAAMAEAVLTLLGDDTRRARMAEAARRHVRESFGWDRLVHEMEALYDTVARPRRDRERNA
jgi:glycosyltransferase involved in cell wall biosynthesis